MQGEQIDVDRLSGVQVRSLLAVAAGRQSRAGTSEILDILREALCEDSTANLKIALKDLRRPLKIVDDGPLSFARLTPLDGAGKRLVQGQDTLKVLTSPQTSQPILNALNDYGKLLCGEDFPTTTRLTGVLIRILAVAAMVARHGKQVDRREAATISTVLKAISTTRILPKKVLDDYTILIRDASTGQ